MAQVVLYGPSGLPLNPQTPAIIDPTFAALRASIRPMEYVFPKNTFGQYSAVALTGATVSIGAAGILASLRWVDSTNFLTLLRLGVILEITGAITIATPLDVQAFVFRGSSGAASGGGVVAGGAASNNQKLRGSMGSSLLLANGELRVATSAALTAAAGKTNDGAPFGVAMFGTQMGPNVGATANVTAPIGAIVTGMQDIYKLDNPYKHPIVLGNNDGIEVQVITAGPVTGSVKYGLLFEWAETPQF